MPTRTTPAALPTEQVHRALAPSRARLLARDDRIVRTQIELSEIAAPTGEEGERAAWIAHRFGVLGLRDVRVDAVGNVSGRRPGLVAGERAVVVCAHLDTVFPRETPLAVERIGDRLVGPGIGDNGRGLAAMLALAEEIDGAALRTHRPVDFVATVGEEGLGDLRGAKHYFANADTPAAAIALDGAGDERIVHRALGSRRFRIAYHGTGGHSWAAFGVANAVHAAAAAASKIAAVELPLSPRTTLSVGRIGGGISVNAIPRDGWLEVDLRSTSAASIERYAYELHMIAHEAAQEENARRGMGTPPLRYTVEVIGDRPGGELAADHALVLSAMSATRLVGRSPDLATASTDANVPIALGVPAIALGAGGRGGDAHTPHEWFDNAQGSLGIARALTVVVDAAGLA